MTTTTAVHQRANLMDFIHWILSNRDICVYYYATGEQCLAQWNPTRATNCSDKLFIYTKFRSGFTHQKFFAFLGCIFMLFIFLSLSIALPGLNE